MPWRIGLTLLGGLLALAGLPVRAQTAPTLGVSPNPVAAGQPVTVSWAGDTAWTGGPSDAIWAFPASAVFQDWSTAGALGVTPTGPSGSVSVFVPATVPPGEYVWVLMAQSGPAQVEVARSSPVTVALALTATPSATFTPSPIPTATLTPSATPTPLGPCIIHIEVGGPGGPNVTITRCEGI